MLNDARKNEIDDLLNNLGLSVNDYNLFDIALTHSSYNFENKLEDGENYERLEFLGDAVLKLIASRYLYSRFPDYPEGELTKIRAILVSDKTLALLAEKINLGKHIKLGYHEEKSGGRKRSSTLACAFEAILGAFYLDGKMDSLYEFLAKLIEDAVTDIDESATKHNCKAMLQEYTQSLGLGIPQYITIYEEGPPHDKIFRVEVQVSEQSLGVGEGKTKKDAHQKAARNAVIALGLIEGHEK